MTSDGCPCLMIHRRFFAVFSPLSTGITGDGKKAQHGRFIRIKYIESSIFWYDVGFFRYDIQHSCSSKEGMYNNALACKHATIYSCRRSFTLDGSVRSRSFLDCLRRAVYCRIPGKLLRQHRLFPIEQQKPHSRWSPNELQQWLTHHYCCRWQQ